MHEPDGVADVGQDRGGFIFAQRASLDDVVEELATRQQLRNSVELVLVHDRVFQ